MAQKVLYSIGEVAAVLGVSPHTIRAWERRHHVVAPERTSSGQRRYTGDAIELLRDIKRAITLNGLSLRLAVRAATEGETIDHPATRVRSRRAVGDLKNQDLWRSVVDVIPQLVFVIDETGRIVESNIASARLFGVTVQQIRGRPFVDLVDPFDRSKAALLFQQGLRTVDGWELNLAASDRGPLYSFHSWVVRQGTETFAILVGSEMFVAQAVASMLSSGASQGPDGRDPGPYLEWLEGLLGDSRFEQLNSPQQLGDVAVEHLQNLLPTVEFVLAITFPSQPGVQTSVSRSLAAHKTLAEDAGAAAAFHRVVRAVGAAPVPDELRAVIRGQPSTVTTIPVDAKQRFGVLAWSRPVQDPLTDGERRAIDAFVAWISVAGEGLRARLERTRQSARFSDVVTAASVLRSYADPGTIATSFLEHLARLVNADMAAIVRVAGSDCIVEAVHAPQGSLTKPGDRFRLLGIYSSAARTGLPTGGTGMPARLPEFLQRKYRAIKHFIAVPLVFHGRTSRIVSLARFADRPFNQGEVDVVQALSATAELAIGLPGKRGHPVTSSHSRLSA